MSKISLDISPSGPYFSVLRASVWQKPVETSAWPEIVDWNPIMDNYMAQCLLPFVGDVLMTLPKQYALTQEQQDRILSVSAQYISAHYKIRKAIVEVFTALEEAGCHPILLKGEGLAQLYPKPNIRAVGDIDIYMPAHKEQIQKYSRDLDKTEYYKAAHILNNIADVKEDCENYDHELYARELLNSDKSTVRGYNDALITANFHHLEYLYKGFLIEHHRYPNGIVDKQTQKFFDLYVDKFTEESIEKVILLNNFAVRVPDTFTNCVFVFFHACRHIRGGGVGLRQIIDWTYTIRKLIREQGEDSIFKLEQSLKEIDCYKEYQAIMPFVCEVLGLSSILTHKQNKPVSKSALEYFIYPDSFGGEFQGQTESNFKAENRIFALLREPIDAYKKYKSYRNFLGSYAFSKIYFHYLINLNKQRIRRLFN